MVKCLFCKSSEKIVKAGFRDNDSGKKQRYWCKKCNSRFVPNDGFWKMKHKPEVIAEAISCRKRGMPYQEVSKHFREYNRANICPATAYNWVQKYGKVLRNFNLKQIPELSGKINLDEFVSKFKKKLYRWVSKDRNTKFRINAFSSEKRTYRDGPQKVYTDIKKRFYNQFLEAKKHGSKFNFTTDMLAHYKKGFTKYFFNVATLTHGVPIKCKKYGLKRNNLVNFLKSQRIEKFRLPSEIKVNNINE